MNKEISSFIDRYVKEIKNNSAAMFIGAGFSKSAGYVDWKNLLKDVADDLELDIDKEYDLVSLAQYCYNKNRNRSIINDLIFDEFNKEKGIDENHRIIARLPIFTYWTTNYDSLIEEALEEAQRIVDIKYNNKQLSLTKPHRDAVVYKMHGDKNNPDEAILIKDDYEKYYREHAQFITALSGDLISKTFLFIGFSFSDPNIDYILSRVRIDYGEQNNRQHYAIMRRVNEKDYNNRAEYEYAQRKHEFFIEDLKRYNIRALLIDEYKEITDILNEIDKRLNHNNVFISGSAQEYGKYTEKEALEFIESLSKELILQDFNIISGFGLGVGSAVIIGALQEIYMKRKSINEDRLLLRPFPQGIEDNNTRQILWKKYREDMISRSGVSIFLFGNKLVDGEIVLANGVESEYKIALERHCLIVPVGCTGYMAEEIWEKVDSNMSDFYTNVDDVLIEAFKKLNSKSSKSELITNILSFIKLFENGKYSPRKNGRKGNMAHKTFISYKWSEAQDLRDDIITALGEDATYYKGETSESPDLTDTSTENIKKNLKDMMYDTSVTIVILSPNMKESKWIDWEIEYCLKDITRKDRTSHTNGVVAVIMKVDNSYEWFKKSGTNCHGSSTVSYELDKVFDIISQNHFNSNPEQWHCDKCKTYDWLNGSYITFVEEETFMDDPEKYINNAYDKSENDASGYDLVKQR